MVLSRNDYDRVLNEPTAVDIKVHLSYLKTTPFSWTFDYIKKMHAMKIFSTNWIPSRVESYAYIKLTLL